ncbi:sensor histidine kinase [Solirubrobacter pauli]|uniref:sensor histidine kinase n=1 Tax=Solirubrobacter pauli TaxID=166793 RepID=UPI0011C42070|nr:histidine kinase [Solirubrobacter pauli]
MRRWVWPVAVAAILLGFALLDEHSPAAVVNRAVGGSFIVCGLVVWQRRPDTRTGALMTATGFLDLIPQLLGESGAPALHTLGEAFANVWLAGFGALVLSFPSGRLKGFDRVLVGAWVFGTLIWQIVWLLFLPGDDNVLALWPDAGAADAIDTAQRWFNTLVGTAIAAVALARWWRAGPALRALLLPSLAGALAIIVLAVHSYSSLLVGDWMRPTQELTAFVLFAVPVAFLFGMLRAQLARAGMADLVVALQRAPDEHTLGEILARTLHDPSLELVFWLPGFETYVDEDGRPFPPPADGRVLTPIEHDGVPVAALVHDAALTYEPDLLAGVCAAADVALAHTRLVQELSRSRVRIVEAGDAARRRIERDLHDGAQQRLVSLAIALRLTEDRIKEDPDTAVTLVAAARKELSESLEELRELARGIHPAVLEHGLATALSSLAIRSPTPVQVTCALDGPLPEAVELALYFVACEGLANVAKYAHADAAEVRVTRHGDEVEIEVRDDGVGGADGAGGSGLRGLADRVEALGGRLRVSSPAGAGTVLRAELPCGAGTRTLARS